MNRKLKITIRSTGLLLAALLLAGCSKPSEPAPSPKVAAEAKPTAATPSDPKRLYCKEHQCYEDECFFCHEELREKGRLWCKEHNRYEDRCWLCHPDERDPKRAYCEKHFLYDNECFLCHPELKAKPKPGAQTNAGKPLLCKEHGVPEDECGICHPELAAGKTVKVRFPSREAAGKAGIETALPQISAMAGGVECYAEIMFDQNKLAHIAPPVAGTIHSVEVDVGSRVEERAVLVRIASAEIAEAVAKARLAEQTLARERKLRGERISSEKDLQAAEAAQMAAHQQLMSFGLDGLTDSTLLELRAPFAGEIVERNAVRGARVEAGKEIFTIADRSMMWAILNIPEAQLAHVRVGQKVELSVEALPEEKFVGTLTWIAAQVDDRTRMVKARAEVANPDAVLRSKMFARARVLTSESEKAVLVPHGAIQKLDGTSLVFVKIAADLFEAHPVRLGATQDGQTEIVAGINREDEVVIVNSFVCKSQLLISRLGAGCTD